MIIIASDIKRPDPRRRRASKFPFVAGPTYPFAAPVNLNLRTSLQTLYISFVHLHLHRQPGNSPSLRRTVISSFDYSQIHEKSQARLI
jgi:hypothetical protein